MSSKLLLFLGLQVICIFARPQHVSSTIRGDGSQKYLDTVLSQTIWSVVLPTLKKLHSWDSGKQDEILNLIRAVSSEGNITLIGWQNILNEKGDVEEVRAIEFTVKGGWANHLPITKGYYESLNADEESTLEEHMPIMLATSNSFKEYLGVPMAGYQTFWDKEGTLESGSYFDIRDAFLYDSDNGGLLTRNITVGSLDEVKTFAKSLESDLPISFLEWNQDKTFNKERSIIIPEVLTSCTDQENASYKMIESAVAALTEGYLNEGENVLKHVSQVMSQRFPTYTWTAFQDLGASYVRKDVSIELSLYKNLYDDETFDVVVYGFVNQ